MRVPNDIQTYNKNFTGWVANATLKYEAFAIGRPQHPFSLVSAESEKDPTGIIVKKSKP